MLGYKEETNVAHCLVRIFVSLSDLFPYTEYTYIGHAIAHYAALNGHYSGMDGHISKILVCLELSDYRLHNQ